MKRWLLMTGGLLVWAAHFLGVYLISSAADVWSSVDALGARVVGLAFSVACLAAAIGLMAMILRRPRPAPDVVVWEQQVGLTGAGLSAIAIIWQTAPLAF